MLSLADCLDFSGLSDDEVTVIAEHEHLPRIVAAELGSQLLESRDGLCKLKGFVLDNLECATHRGQFDKAGQLATLYRRFDATHPKVRNL